MPARKTAAPETIFDAARACDVESARRFVDEGARLDALDPHGFTALHCAAMGSNVARPEDALATIRLLVEAGAPLEHPGRDGRTPFYMTAEFSPEVAPLAYLAEAGAKVDVEANGVHVIENAMMEEAQDFISRLTGRPIPAEPEPEPEPVRMPTAAWRAAKAKLDAVFATLEQAGLVVLQDAGTTQSDGFSDCVEVWHERGGREAGPHGFCFYTRQDLQRAKNTGGLSLAFWGAPDGADPDMERVGRLVVSTFEAAGVPVRWNGSPGTRPDLDLRGFAR